MATIQNSSRCLTFDCVYGQTFPDLYRFEDINATYYVKNCENMINNVHFFNQLVKALLNLLIRTSSTNTWNSVKQAWPTKVKNKLTPIKPKYACISSFIFLLAPGITSESAMRASIPDTSTAKMKNGCAASAIDASKKF